MESFKKSIKDYLNTGVPFIWMCGGALMLSLMMVAGLLGLIMYMAFGQFWAKDLISYNLKDGSAVMGEVRQVEERLDEETNTLRTRIQLKTGNRDVYGLDFKWIEQDEVEKEERPLDAVTVERLEWGNFNGYVKAIKEGDKVIAEGPDALRMIATMLPQKHKLAKRIKKVETNDLGRINIQIEKLRVTKDEQDGSLKTLQSLYDELDSSISKMRDELESHTVVLSTVDGEQKELSMGAIVRIYSPNQMSTLDKALLYASKFWEFLADDPRESNTEGGVFPAIFGTVMMVLIMTVAVIPLGVLAALYLREYAKQGAMVRFVRICVNNLAGVPSIVFGVFGLGFFIYGVGGSIDRMLFADALPTPTFGTGGILWASLTLALLTLPVVIVSTEEGLASVGRDLRLGSLALGATKFETIWKVVLPSAAPGIFTGMILAVARATGEVAPLMITGVVKMAPSLPLDSTFPFIHLERKFMHLGFHIYDVGFQSPNVEAAISMVYSTTFLLLFIVVVLNLAAILIRNNLRKKYATSAF